MLYSLTRVVSHSLSQYSQLDPYHKAEGKIKYHMTANLCHNYKLTSEMYYFGGCDYCGASLTHFIFNL